MSVGSVQVLSIVGLQNGTFGLQLVVETGPPWPAWDFSNGFNVPNGCHPASAVTVSPLGSSCPPAAIPRRAR